nr:MAG TPA: hypothetical protein [Caudoviricetes sp.]
MYFVSVLCLSALHYSKLDLLCQLFFVCLLYFFVNAWYFRGTIL